MEELLKSAVGRITENIAKVVVGKNDAAELMLTALIAGGHVLIEDYPGTGKTTLALALAKSLRLEFRRIQFTPDVLPSDVTGYTALDMRTGEREVRFGAVMAQLVLADEINRTGPKTQSSLLEVMQEGQVTIDGRSYAVPQPFMVVATENPIEQVGTYPLPEAQLDRFLLRISLGYPSRAEELEILARNKGAQPLDTLTAVASAEDILVLRELHKKVVCADPVREYIVSIAEATRKNSRIALGVSPRGSLALMNACAARAIVKGRDFVLPDDVQALAEPVLAHRIVTERRKGALREKPADVLASIIREIKVPAVR